MSDPTLYDTTAPSDGSVALAHERLIRMKINGVWINITGDINNLVLAPTDVTVTREVYGTKGAQNNDSIARNFAPTFTVEAVRDPETKQFVAAQDWFLDLYAAAFSLGDAQKREFQIFTDALDERMPVFEGKFRVTTTDGNSGYADKAAFNFALENAGRVVEIDSPLAGDGTPILESASPSGLTVGDAIVVRGYNVGPGEFVSATIDGVAVVKARPVDRHQVVLVIPTGVTGSAPIVVTNTQGASSALAYNAA